MDPYSLKTIADQKMAEDHAWAAQHRLTVEADQAQRAARQPAGSPLAGLLWTLAGVFGLRRPALLRE